MGTLKERYILSIDKYPALAVCLTEQCGKLVEIIVPCQICDHCGLLYRQLRSMFHTLSSDRCNYQLNLAVIRMSSQLGQEQCFFSAGGLLLMNNVTLGKVRLSLGIYIYILKYHLLSLVYIRHSQLLRYMHTISLDILGEIGSCKGTHDE